MLKSEVVHTRVTPDLKHSVQAVLGRVGLSTTDAVSLFFHQIVLHDGLPFDVRVPNKATRQAIKEARTGKNMKTYASVEKMRLAIEQKPAKKRKKVLC